MTWSWFLFKTVTTTVTNTITLATPIGWVAGGVGGGAASQLAINHNQEVLENHDSTFDDKISSLKIIEWATDYRNGLVFGAAAKGVGFLLKGGEVAANAVASTSERTAAIGKDAAKEIARNGGKFTPMARQLILQGKNLARAEIVAEKVTKELAIKIADNASRDFVVKETLGLLSSISGEIYKRINKDEDSLSSVVTLIEVIEKTLLEMRNLNLERLRDFIKELLEINQKNVSCYIKWGVNYNHHWRINDRVNRALRVARSL